MRVAKSKRSRKSFATARDKKALMSCRSSRLFRTKIWCRGRESNPHGAKLQRIFLPLRLSPPGCCQFVVWTIPSPFTNNVAVRREPSSLYTFSQSMHASLARCCQMKGFTEFDSIHTGDFAPGAQISKSVASTNSATPAERLGV